MTYLLDSNLLIYSADAANAFLRPLVSNADNYVSAITQVETLGYHRLSATDKLYFQSLFALLGILPVTPAVIGRAVALRQQRRLSLGDALIAATALEFGLDLATRNVADFAPIGGLQVFDPFAA